MELERCIKSIQTASIIDILKEIPFLEFDIYRDILLGKNQHDILEGRREEMETLFLSEILNVKPKAIYFHDSKIVSQGYDERKHNLWINSQILSGEEIMRIGFSIMYGRAKEIKDEGAAVNLLSLSQTGPRNIKKEEREYNLTIYDVDDLTRNLTEKDKKIIEEYNSQLISLVKKNIY